MDRKHHSLISKQDGRIDLRKDLKISSVTLNWNGAATLYQCIASLKNQDMDLYEIIVADNGSDDKSIEIIEKDFLDVVIVRNKANLGAPCGRNCGLRRALEKPVDYIFTLDNDLFAERSCVRELVTHAENNPEIGIIGAFIYDAKNANRLISAGGVVRYTQNVGGQLIRYPSGQTLIDVDYCGTGHMLTKRKVFDRIGLLDEIFIGYGFEDTDFSFRSKRAGFRICTSPAAKVWHKPHSNIGDYSFSKKYLESRNAVVFMKRYANFSKWIKFIFFAVLGLPYAFVVQGVIRHKMSGVWGKVRGLFDGFCNKEKKAYEILS